MIKFYRVIGASSLINWAICQFPDEKHALDEYNSEVRRAHSERIDDGRPELEFIEDAHEVEYYLTEEEMTHSAVTRDAALETGRWGLARKRPDA